MTQFPPSQTALAHRNAAIDPFRVMEIQEHAHRLELAGRSIIHMEIGQPDFGAPPQVLRAAVEAIQGLLLGYTGALGITELRQALSAFYEQKFGVAVPWQRIAITAGASGALLLTLGALVNAGDEVLMSDPCYPCNRNFVRLFDGIPVSVPAGPRQNYQLTLDDVKQHWTSKSRGVLVTSPSNPTGTIINTRELNEIASWVSQHGGFLIVDEIYQSLVYEIEPVTALSLSPDIYVINSFSKYFGMTGWRLGWLVAPERSMRDIEKLAQNVFICPSAPAQYAALAAFSTDTLAILEDRRLELQRRRDFLLPALRTLGFSLPVHPQGAFYLYAGCENFGLEGAALALHLLDEAGVAVTPGLDFSLHNPDSHLRFAYTRSIPELQAGVERISELSLFRSARPMMP